MGHYSDLILNLICTALGNEWKSIDKSDSDISKILFFVFLYNCFYWILVGAATKLLTTV